jgi:cephalosporin hydroxylase
MMDGAEHIITVLVESATGDRLLAQDDVQFLTSKELSHTASREQRRNFQLVWYFESAAWRKQTWLGVPMQKYSGDLVTYQELLNVLKPKVLVEFGTGHGGSALYFAGVLHQVHANAQQRECEVNSCRDGYRVLTVDRTFKRLFARARQVAQIEFLESESTAMPVQERIVQLRAEYGGPFLFILDTDHHSRQVLAELRLLHPILAAGDQIVVEHTYLDDGGSKPTKEFDGGPGKAIAAFMKEHAHNYVQDTTVGWKQVFTQADSGFIRRV